MRVRQAKFDSTGGWEASYSDSSAPPDLILAFADTQTVERDDFYGTLLQAYNASPVVFVSAADFIVGSDVAEGGGSATLIWFDDTSVQAVAEPVANPEDSERAGEALGRALKSVELRHVLIFSEGLEINGTALLRGISNVLGSGITITGGLASDGEKFQRTVVGLSERPTANRAVAIGLSGKNIEVGIGSFGGWEPFGEEMVVTHSSGNVVHQLDGQPALDVYERLLGSRAYALPASGLLYPLQIQSSDGENALVRTLLGVDAVNRTVTFAGDVPMNSLVKVLHANLDEIIDASSSAATMSREKLEQPTLAILVSCIGRKLLLQLRTQEEVAAARAVLGPQAVFAGFYSYGEISPDRAQVECRLQNQTMTITTLAERPQRARDSKLRETEFRSP